MSHWTFFFQFRSFSPLAAFVANADAAGYPADPVGYPADADGYPAHEDGYPAHADAHADADTYPGIESAKRRYLRPRSVASDFGADKTRTLHIEHVRDECCVDFKCNIGERQGYINRWGSEAMEQKLCEYSVVE